MANEKTIQPIRILHVIGIMNRGGAETMIMNLYRKIDREHFQFDFVVHSEEEGIYGEEIHQLGGEIYHCPRFTIKNLHQYRSWWHKFFQTHPEHSIIHGHIGSSAAVYLSIAKKYRKYTIAHSHNTGYGVGLKSVAYQVVSYPTRYIADAFLACSNEAGISRFGKYIASNQKDYHILRNAIPTKDFQYNAQERKLVREELGYESGTIVIGHVGRFYKEKNQAFLVEIFEKFVQKQPDSCLMLVGDGPFRQTVEEEVQKRNLGERVKFLGVRTDINRLMKAMDVFAMPSLYEGLPLVLVEAQSSGLPCLISDRIPSESILVKELVTQESLQKPVDDWADQLGQMIVSDRKPRASYRNQVVENGFDIDDTTKWLEGFYDERSK